MELKWYANLSLQIPYDKPITLKGTPNIKFDSIEESVDAVKLVESPIDIISKSNSELYFS